MGVEQRRQTHPLHLLQQQRNVVDSLGNDVQYLIHAQSLAQSGIYLQIWANRKDTLPIRSINSSYSEFQAAGIDYSIGHMS